MQRGPAETLGEGGHCFGLQPVLTIGLHLLGVPASGTGQDCWEWPAWARLSDSFSLELGAQCSVPGILPGISPNAREQVKLLPDPGYVCGVPCVPQTILLGCLWPWSKGAARANHGAQSRVPGWILAAPGEIRPIDWKCWLWPCLGGSPNVQSMQNLDFETS